MTRETGKLKKNRVEVEEKKKKPDNGIKMKQEYYTRPMNNIACSGCIACKLKSQ